MTELTIYGRGGQGGVTLAKLIATAFFRRGKHVQAFGVYAAERSGAPLQAFVRIDDDEITNHNQIHEPDHIIVLDRTLIDRRVLTGLKPDGWVVLNTSEAPEAFSELFAGRNVLTVDATGIAVANGLGTKTVPIVNTTLLGAAAGPLGLSLEDVEGALEEVKFTGPNVTSARQAFDAACTERLDGTLVSVSSTVADGTPVGLLDDDVGQMPRIRTGDWATRNPHRRRLTPPCSDGCPAGNDVRGFIEAIAREEFDEALGILMDTSPLPGVCGRVCPAPCEEACNRSEHDDEIGIRDLERYAADHGRRPAATKPTRTETVAVVGSGPAGLSATYHLARLGYPVTLFEAGKELGGVLRTGIPGYRLPRDILDAEIGHILRHGVTVQYDVRVGREKLLKLSHTFAAVFVATGLQETRALDLGPSSSDVVEEGIEFLDRVRKGKASLLDRDVVVVGGGNTAIDAARSARRVGARGVRIVYRRTRAEMPAIKEEIDEALEEGIILDELVLPLRLRCDYPTAATGSGRHTRMTAMLTCQRMELGEPDASGRPRPVPARTEDAQFDIRCDRVLLALGQSADLSILPEGSDVTDEGVLLGLSGTPIFAGGDFAFNDGTVTAAIGGGRKAAWHMHKTLAGEDLFTPSSEPVATPERITMHIFSHAPREEAVLVDPSKRRRSFTEVRLGLIDEPSRRPAVAEARRCFSCGVCNLCDRCVSYCPEGIVVRDGHDEYRFDYDYCKGCGICASQCPRGVVYMADL